MNTPCWIIASVLIVHLACHPATNGRVLTVEQFRSMYQEGQIALIELHDPSCLFKTFTRIELKDGRYRYLRIKEAEPIIEEYRIPYMNYDEWFGPIALLFCFMARFALLISADRTTRLIRS